MKQQHKTETPYNYKGITIHAAPGLHEHAIEVLMRRCRGNDHVLDLGCGSGAFTKRLQDHGFVTTAVDLSLDTLGPDTECHQLDFNSDFATCLGGKNFNAIVALEVLEHLENPLHFLRQLKLIANQQTIILISFPNIYLYWSLHSFYRNGTFANWSPFLYWETGHQSLLTDWLFEEHLKKTGFSPEEKHFCAHVNFPKNLKSFILHKIFFKLICRFNHAISPEVRSSEAVLYLLKKKNENPEEIAPREGRVV
jgi:2-polyprenyl-3-methyl-5-hydroxy-6-metoxy-1,4-benzoquinol methylase